MSSISGSIESRGSNCMSLQGTWLCKAKNGFFLRKGESGGWKRKVTFSSKTRVSTKTEL